MSENEVASAALGGELIVLTGGVRAGKSDLAEQIARAQGGGEVTYVATAQALDGEMEERIAKHRATRDARWETIETSRDVAAALRAARHGVVLLDCVTLLVTNALLGEGEPAARAEIDALLAARHETGKTLVAVTNEVGWGIVPDNALAREFRDLLGWANRRLMEDATTGCLVVAGQVLVLKGARTW